MFTHHLRSSAAWFVGAGKRRNAARAASPGRRRAVRCESLESRICLSAVLNIPGISTVLAANDDESAGPVDLPVSMNFFGTTYSQVYVNNNGNVTFTAVLSDYTPDDLNAPGHIPEIAAFFADVDTSGVGSGLVTYGSTSTPFDFGSTEGVHNAFVVNYPNVGYYNTNVDKLNNFQLILIDRSDTGAGNFDIEFNYNQVQWETGDASGGADGLGGGTSAAAVGYTAGTGVAGTFDVLPGSFTAGALIDGGPDALVSHMLNSSVPGQYILQVRNGAVTTSPSTQLAFSQQPTTATAGAATTSPITIDVEDANGNPVSSDTSNVTLSIASGPSGSTIGGTTTLAAVNGIATFTGLDFSAAGTYTLSASDGSLTAATSGSFSVLPPGLDSRFGSADGGTVSVPFVAEQLVPTPGGQIFAIGHEGNTTNKTSQGVIEMLNSDGSTATSYGSNGNGMVTTNVANDYALYGAVVDPAGNLLAAGGANGSFIVGRYLPDGTQDPSFGAGGFTLINFGADGPANASAVAIEPDGSIIVGGEANNVFALARVTASGALDSSFNPNGADDSTFPAGGQMTIPTGSAGAVTQILIQGDGKILGVGSTGAHVAVFRLNYDGSADTSFGAGGIATVTQLASADPVNGAPILEGIGLQPGGNILVSGEGPSGGLAAIQLDSAGQLDSTFNNGQTVVASFGGANDDETAIAVNSADSGFVLIGTTNTGGVSQVAVAGFNSDGTVNASFGINGQVTIPELAAPLASSLSSPASAPGIARPFAFHPQLTDFAFGNFQADGKLLVGSSGSASAALSRIQAFSSPQTAIGEFGKVGRKNVKLPTFTLANGTRVTITLAGGTGMASFVGDNVTLTLSGSTAVTIRTSGGTGTLGLSNVTSSGVLRSFTAPAATLRGTLTAPGVISTLKLGTIAGVVIAGGINNLSAAAVSGSISVAGALRTARVGRVTGAIAAGEILNLSASSLSGARILAGINLGSDGQLGGAGGAADNYGPGEIVTLKAGTIADSFIGAGVNPVDGLFGNGDDTAAGTSLIRSITSASVDAQTRFEAATFPKVAHFPGKDLPSADPRFVFV